jgi:pantoate--beta-alanine ligase
MKIVRTCSELRALTSAWRQDGLRIGFVPTMGALHAGHLSLIDISRQQAARTIASLFVNPAQFAPNEDFAAYPRDESRDMAMFAQAGVDLVYAPPVEQIYPQGHAASITIGGISEILEGEIRPQFFSGVASIVTILFNQVQPDLAVFGEKDYQQLCVIRKLVRDLHMPIEIIGGETIRETCGLAMSSRNKYLTDCERRQAPALYRTLCEIARGVRTGENPDQLCELAANTLSETGFGKLDYVTVRDAVTLRPHAEPGRPARVLAATWLGKARLIDNVAV